MYIRKYKCCGDDKINKMHLHAYLCKKETDEVNTSPHPLCKGGADVVNTLSFPPLSGGAKESYQGGMKNISSLAPLCKGGC